MSEMETKTEVGAEAFTDELSGKAPDRAIVADSSGAAVGREG